MAKALSGLSIIEQSELLFSRYINFKDLPAWQKRGVGLRWEDYEKPGFNPHAGEVTMAIRWRIARDLELPLRQPWTRYLEERTEDACIECLRKPERRRQHTSTQTNRSSSTKE